jgi:hypothetical protein
MNGCNLLFEISLKFIIGSLTIVDLALPPFLISEHG